MAFESKRSWAMQCHRYLVLTRVWMVGTKFPLGALVASWGWGPQGWILASRWIRVSWGLHGWILAFLGRQGMDCGFLGPSKAHLNGARGGPCFAVFHVSFHSPSRFKFNVLLRFILRCALCFVSHLVSFFFLGPEGAPATAPGF